MMMKLFLIFLLISPVEGWGHRGYSNSGYKVYYNNGHQNVHREVYKKYNGRAYVNDFEPETDLVIKTRITKQIKTQLSKLHKSLNSKNIKHRVFRSSTCKDHLIMVHLLNDHTAIELARAFNFPRGFPIIWNETEGFHLYGFYPKFQNDQKQRNNLKEFAGAEMINLTLKYSGFLGQVIIWKSDGNLYWTCASKNSVGNDFSSDGIRIINKEQIMTPDNIREMYESGNYFCGEVMSTKDQTHGARVLDDRFVCTCVGKYTRILPDQVHDKNRFVEFLSHQEMQEFCIKHRIPVSDMWSSEDVMTMAQEIARHRDTMTMAKLRDILAKYHCSPGTVKHEDVLGTIIEGLVIWLWVPGMASPKVIKYKFPIYTTRTFGIREFLNKGKPMLSTFFKKHVDNYLDFWVTGKEGKEYWQKWFYSIALLEDSFPEQVPNIGRHIQYADFVESPIDDVVNNFNSRLGLPVITGRATVIAVVGPIGAGKTTYGDYLESQIPNSHHIDGDDLGLKVPTMELGQERNAATLTCIMDTLASGKIPIISCGGGILFQGGDMVLNDMFKEKLGLEADLVVYMPCGTKKSEIMAFYTEWKVDSIIRYRRKEGIWTTRKTGENSLKAIQKLSTDNNQFACKLIDHASEVIEYIPLGKARKTIATGLPKSYSYPPKITNIHLNQIRILVQYDTKKQSKTGHITIHYSNDLRTIAHDNILKLRAQLKGIGKVQSTMVQCTGCAFIVVPKATTTMLLEMLRELGIDSHPNLHVTVSPGKHMPHLMKDATIQYRGGTSSIVLDTKNGETVTYSSWKESNVDVALSDVIYL